MTSSVRFFFYAHRARSIRTTKLLTPEAALTSYRRTTQNAMFELSALNPYFTRFNYIFSGKVMVY